MDATADLGLIEFMSTRTFWVGLLQIIWIDIILSGDNALVIALACRNLPKEQRRLGITLGVGAAIILRILFASVIVYLLQIPYLKLVGSALLMWIAIKLIMPGATESHDEGGGGSSSLWSVIQTVVIADAVMSLDNVISVAAAAKGSIFLLSLGIVISIPLMMVGSSMMLWALDRFSWLMIAGGGLLGWIAGELAVHDPALQSWIEGALPWLIEAAPFLGAALVVALGHWFSRGKPPSNPHALPAGGDSH